MKGRLLLAKKAIRLPDRFQKLLSFSSSDKIQYRTQPGSFSENQLQLLYPARQFSHICHSILANSFFITIEKTRFKCYHIAEKISFNPPASKAAAERRVFLCKGASIRGAIRSNQKAQHQ